MKLVIKDLDQHRYDYVILSTFKGHRLTKYHIVTHRRLKDIIAFLDLPVDL